MADAASTTSAPDFPAGMEWLNTDRPLSLKELRGKVVLLDFWTYCCINCMHVLPDLHRLEMKYRTELVVIGVHSAKFTSEKETDNIRQAILRYGIEHPVVNDRDLRIWSEYGVRAWPTLCVIDPAGKIVGSVSGEGIYDILDGEIGKIVSRFEKEGKLNRAPVAFKLEREGVKPSPLAFPGKVLADEPGERLFISDSNHNRILIASLDGAVADVAGSGEEGLKDGPFGEAAFYRPQGLALVGDALYVADTENHAIRRLDLKARTVRTVAGTGEQARSPRSPGEMATGRVELNSPWDLVALGDQLYIAMAGPHQLWRMDLRSGEIGPFAGSGREARVDGTLASACLAQPSGITSDGGTLYFADSEVSSIRSATTGAKGRVQTIVGGDLFEFGDRDGRGDAVRLQHPLGIAWHAGMLYVADTYNNKIKTVDPAARTAKTFLGTGEAGWKDGAGAEAAFSEPGGLSIAGGRLFIADTNNHAVRVADMKTRAVSTLQLTGLEKFARNTPELPSPPRTRVALPAVRAGTGPGKIVISLKLPPGYKVNDTAPTKLALRLDGKVVRFAEAKRGQAAFRPPEKVPDPFSSTRLFDKPAFPLEVPVEIAPGEATVIADLWVYYCREGDEAACFFQEARMELPVRGEAGGGEHSLNVVYEVKR